MLALDTTPVTIRQKGGKSDASVMREQLGAVAAPASWVSSLANLPARAVFFFFNDTAPTEIYTLSLHDALPILAIAAGIGPSSGAPSATDWSGYLHDPADRTSTRLHSRHVKISYAVFCVKK